MDISNTAVLMQKNSRWQFNYIHLITLKIRVAEFGEPKKKRGTLKFLF